MAASSVAGPATPLPLSPTTESPSSTLSPQPPHPPPPTTAGLQETDREHEELLTPTKAPDFLPPQMLQTLKQQQRSSQEPLPQLTASPWRLQQSPKKEAQVCLQCGLPSVKPPAKLWGYPRQRSKFTHLTTHPPCVCGAGNSDISFLYDVPDDQKGKDLKELPPSLIPNEYHIHKKVGVVGLEFHEDQYTTQSLAHDRHVTVFPSMNPSSRYEVLALKNTMDTMLQKAGLPRQGTELKGPTQVHNLLELVRQEQIIYSICFHELIRQVSVQCAERGELLQEIRSRYTQLLDRIPRQVMSLHEDMLSQRALCKRISAEYKQFRAKVSSVTDRLGRLRDIDTEVVKETLSAHRDLSSALTESEKNANLLKEYHEVYELQRKRMQNSVDKLREERDLWEGAAFSLAQQVLKEGEEEEEEGGTLALRTLRRLQFGEKAWAQLARHFTPLFHQTDIKQLGEVDECVRRWREGVMGESGRLEETEKALNIRLSGVEGGMKRWYEELRNTVAADGRVIPLSRERLQGLWEEVRGWLRALNSESDQYSGETQLARTQGLTTLNTLVERWTEVGLEIFSRHQEMNQYDRTPSTGHTHSGSAHSLEHSTMLSLGGEVELGMRHCAARASGDNGVAVGFIRLITPLEAWDSRLGGCVSGRRTLPESDWIKLGSLLGEWLEHLQRIRGFIGTVTNEHGHTLKCTPMNELSISVGKWRSALSHAITSRHTKIASMVTDLHSSMVLWMVRLLLTATHTSWSLSRTQGVGGEKRGNEGEEEDEVGVGLEEDGWDQGMGLTKLLSIDLQEECKNLSLSVKRFTTSLTRSVVVVVEREGERRRREGEAGSEREKELLERLGKEAGQWAEQAELLMTQVLREEEKEKKMEEPRTSDSSLKVEVVSEEDDGSLLPQEIFVMGADLNLHSRSLMEVVSKVPQPQPPSLSELGLLTESDMPRGSGYLPEDTERLARQLHETQAHLEEQKKLTEREEQRVAEAEREVEISQVRLSTLEAQLQQTQSELQEMREQVAAAKTASRGGKGGGRRGRGGGGRPTSRK